MAAIYPDRTQQVMDYLRRYHAEHGWMPSFDEIALACNITAKSQVHYQLNKLERTKRITRVRGQARCIRILEQN